MRTLIISDLHLGERGRRDVLRRPAALERLLGALDGIDRLVLLGDTVEMMSRNPRRSMEQAEPTLREIGRRMGPGREVILVVGNHDAPLVRRWVLERGDRLGIDERVAPTENRALEAVTSWLAPAQVSVRYPGVWLADGVWATHGHYLDRHLIPESAFGLPRRRRAGAAGAPLSPFDYERPRRRRRGARAPETLAARLADRPVATTIELIGELARRAMLPQLPIMLQRVRLAPLTAALIDTQMRHAALLAMSQVAGRLEVPAHTVIFGHVHRSGPLNGEPWPEGERRLLNCGSWTYEPLLVDRAQPPHPYWPGGAVLLETGHPPRALGLLNDLSVDALMDSRR